MQKLRKVISISVMALTVFVMSGLGSLASAASAQPGDLVKAAGNKTVYYLGSDSRLYNIPNEDTYFSWYKDWSGVITISVTDLNSYGNGIPAGFVTMRPGTRLIQRDVTTDNTVYAVETNGILRPITTANAIALYGSTWASRVTKVSDQNFLSYTVSTSLPTGQYPIGTLLKKTTGADVFYFDGTNYRRIANEAAFNANRFNARFIVKTSMSFNASGAEITGMESGLINAAQNGGTIVTPPVVSGSGLTLSLNANTPAAVSVPNNGSRVPMAKVNLTAANDGAITVNTITVKRIGLSSYDDIERVWAEIDGDTIATKKTINSNDEATLVFSPAFVVPAGTTKTIDLIAELSANGGNIGLSITSASAVSATAANIAGSFPIVGNLMSPTSYNVTEVTINSTVSSTSPETIDVGEEAVELGDLKVEYASNTRDITLSSVKLKNIGSEDLAATVSGLYLENKDGDKVATGVIDGKYVSFNFNSYKMTKDNGDETFTIYGNVIDKELTGTSGITLVFNKAEDLVAKETSNGFGVKVNTTAKTVSNFNIKSGVVTVSAKSTNPTDDTVLAGTNGIVALLANIKADSAIVADGMYITVVASSTSFENARVYLNGALIDSFDPTATGPILLDSSISLNAGDNEVKVTVDTVSNATSGKFEVKLTGDETGSIDGLLDSPEYSNGNIVDHEDITGNASSAELTIGSTTATIVRTDGYSNTKTTVQGSTDISLGKFTVKAYKGDVTITKVAVASTTGNTLPYSSIDDVKVKIDGTQVGTTKSFTSTGITLTGLSNKIAKDNTKVIEILASTDTNATGTLAVSLDLTAKDSNGNDVSIAPINTVAFTVTDKGTLTVAKDGNTADSAILASKAGVEQAVASFKLTATNDVAKVTSLTVKNASTTDVRIASYKLYNAAGTLLSTANPFDGETEFTISEGSLNIAADSSAVVTVKAVLNNIENDATATDKELTLVAEEIEFKSSNGSKTTDATISVAANTFYIRKTVPTIALMALPNTTLTSGNQVVSKFTVTADSNADVKIGRLAVKYSATASTSLATTSNAVKINGISKAVTSSINDTDKYIYVDFGTTTPEIVSAGTSKTFEIVTEVTVTGSNRESLTTSIEEANYSAGGSVLVNKSFTWSDSASNTDANNVWFNSFRVKGLPSDTQTLSVN